MDKYGIKEKVSNINLIPELCQALEIFSVYDCECKSITELVYLLQHKLNETIVICQTNDQALGNALIDLKNKVDDLLTKGLVDEVAKILNQMYIDGTLQELVQEAMVDINRKIKENTATIKKEVEDRIQSVNEINEKLSKKQVSINEFLIKGRTDTEALIEAGKSRKTVLFDIRREMTLDGTVPLIEGTKFIGTDNTININGVTSGFKFSRENKFQNFIINFKAPIYNGNLFELSCKSMVDFGIRIKENMANVFIENIRIESNYTYDGNNGNGTILLAKASKEFYPDGTTFQDGFWNLVVRNIEVKQWMKYFCRGFVDNRNNETNWITDCIFENIKLYSCKYGFLGTEDETTIDNIGYKDITASVWNNISLQCWKSKYMFYFTDGDKKLKNIIPWDYQYALVEKGEHKARPFTFINRGQRLSDYAIQIDNVFPDFHTCFDVRGMNIGSPELYNYVAKSCLGIEDNISKTATSKVMLMETSVQQYKILECEYTTHRPIIAKFKVHLPDILSDYGNSSLEFSFNVTGDKKTKLICINGYLEGSGLNFHYKFEGNKLMLFMKTSKAVGGPAYLETVTQPIQYNDLSGQMVYLEKIDSLPSGTNLIKCLATTIIPYMPKADILSAETDRLGFGTAYFDKDSSELYLKASDWQGIWIKYTGTVVNRTQ